jgi:Polyphosphate kinase 2 (PPK2)
VQELQTADCDDHASNQPDFSWVLTDCRCTLLSRPLNVQGGEILGHSKKNKDPESDAVTDHEAEPETQKLKRKDYEEKLAGLHVELVQLQDWVRREKKKICIVFEGRDAAGKGGVIKALTERVSPRTFAGSGANGAHRARKIANVCSEVYTSSAGRL